MISGVTRGRGYALAGSAALFMAMSFGAGQVLNASNASAPSAFPENPVSGVTLPADVPATQPVAPRRAAPVPGPSVDATSSTIGVAPARPDVCSYAAEMVAGGLPGPLGIGPADQLDVVINKASWAGKLITYEIAYTLPARVRPVSIAMPVAAVADDNGNAHFIVPIGPESQGGVVSILTQARSDASNACDWHAIKIDYNGPEGLVGGLSASLAKNLSGVVDHLTP